jgi:DNA-binding transcriptional ArsR family regulator
MSISGQRFADGVGFTVSALLGLAEESPELAVDHDSQMSRHLRRLERAGAARASRDGRTNAWELTPLGLRLANQLRGVSVA